MNRFIRNPFGWDYPPGAEHDPRAPWNQDPESDPELVQEAIKTAGHLQELLESIEDIEDNHYYNLSKLILALNKIGGDL